MVNIMKENRWPLSLIMIPAIKTPIDWTKSPIIWITAALIFIASPEPPKQPCEWPWPPSCEWPWLWLPGTPWEWPWPEPMRINPRTRLKKIAATEIPIMMSGFISSSWSMNLSIAEYTRIPVMILVNGLKIRLLLSYHRKFRWFEMVDSSKESIPRKFVFLECRF